MSEEETSGQSSYARCKRWVYETIYPSPSKPSRVSATIFDVAMMSLIVASVAIVFVVTSNKLQPDALAACRMAEKVIVWIFVGEYVLRLWTADLRFPPKSEAQDAGKASSKLAAAVSTLMHEIRACFNYVRSPMAIVDLMAILPSFLPYLLPEGMLSIRALRLMRFIRLTSIGKVTQHSETLSSIVGVINQKAKDLLVVLLFMTLIVVLLALFMFLAEHDAQPDALKDAGPAIWWALETFTKAGAHGFRPVTFWGRVVGVVVSVLGYCLLAILTGIITSSLNEELNHRRQSSADEAKGDGANGGDART